MVKSIVFLLVTIGLVALSWRAQVLQRAHGLYRFFAFEAIAALTVLNADVWFRQALSLRQVISWLLLALSLTLAVHGFHLLYAIGLPTGDIEDTTVLVEVGAYRYVRHPLYASLLLLAWGAFLKAPSWTCALLGLVATASLVATARVEENESLRKFGDGYAAYMRRTRMFVPFLF
jgi:protein-S-isoprenylcysteine O-methyltransferase Ste14